MRSRVYAIILACMTAQSAPGWTQQGPSIPVGTVTAERRPITPSSDLVGRVEAPDRVDIRARVTGFIQAIPFKEGDVVKKGDLLYKIDPAPFQAEVQRAQGSVYLAQAKFANATAQRKRTEELQRNNVASRAQLDERIADEKSAQGEIVVADANLKTATINLGYTDIVAPIGGEIGRSKLTEGNLVGPDSGVLTVLLSRDPMYVVFPVSQREFLRVKEQEERRKRGESLAVRVRFSDGTVYGETGKVDFIDVTVDRATDAVTVRAVIPNPKGTLIDGQLVQVAVESGKPEEMVLVPQTALIVDQQGPYVFVVKDGKAEIRRVKLKGETGPSAIIAEGLAGGEQVVVQGLESLRAGAAVTASPAAPGISRS